MRTRRWVRVVPVVAIVAVLVASSCSDDGTDGSEGASTDETTTSTTVPATTSTTVAEIPGDVVDPADLALGECFDDRAVPGQGQVLVDTLVQVPCAGPHRNEVYLVTELDVPLDAPFPGNDEVIDAANEPCLEAFEEFVGVRYELSVFDLGHLHPTEESWSAGDRTVRCFVFDLRGELWEGSAEGQRLCTDDLAMIPDDEPCDVFVSAA